MISLAWGRGSGRGGGVVTRKILLSTLSELSQGPVLPEEDEGKGKSEMSKQELERENAKLKETLAERDATIMELRRRVPRAVEELTE